MRIIPKASLYLEELKKSVHVKNSKDAHKIGSLHKLHTKLTMHRMRLFWLRILLFALLYASIISSITIILDLDYVLPGILDTLFIIVSIFGIVISVILVVLLSQSIDTYDSDIMIIESHLTALYVKNDKSSNEEFDVFMNKAW